MLRRVITVLFVCWVAGWLWTFGRRHRRTRVEGCSGTRCVVDGQVYRASLQICVPASIYLEPTQGWRLMHLLDEGITNHPLLRRAKSKDVADVVVADHSSHGDVVLDERDATRVASTTRRVFKRSFARRRDGVILGPVDPNLLPFHYSVADAYVGSSMVRDLDVVCTLRAGRGEFPLRGRVMAWVRRAMIELGANGYAGEVDSGSRRALSPRYFELMRRAQIVVTANPGDWCGDFRTFEAFASGALVFIDTICPPVPRNFRSGTDVVVYDPGEASYVAFRDKLAYYLRHPRERSRIARNGLARALTFHRAVSRLDWILANAVPNLTVGCSRSQLEPATYLAAEFSRQYPGDALEPPKTPPLDPALLRDLRRPFNRTLKQSRFVGR